MTYQSWTVSCFILFIYSFIYLFAGNPKEARNAWKNARK